MNKDVFNEIGKRLPYGETDEYVSNLVESCTNKAIRSADTKHLRPKFLWLRATKVAAIVAVAVAAALSLKLLTSTNDNATGPEQPATAQNAEYSITDVKHSAPLNEVIAEMSDDQLAMVAYSPTDEIDIPEY